MRDTFFKFMPIVVGGLLGWLLVNPPAALASLGSLRYVVMAVLVLVLLLVWTAVLNAVNLPADVSLEPLTDDVVEGDLRKLRHDFQSLGFLQAGSPYRVGIAPSGVMVAFIHAKEPVFGTIFQTGTIPRKTSFNLVSILEGERGKLTSIPHRHGAVTPVSPGVLLQVFPGARPEKLIEAHYDGLAYLLERGLRARALEAASFPRYFKNSVRRQREVFLSAPLRTAAIALWRIVTGSTPHLGSIRTQPVAQREIEALLSGRAGIAAGDG